ncbi:methyltransferase family protein [Cellulosimicrobium cellulans]|uniref:methyltransferase family protein n=1 Tax=Cellulosimicrobium cellulans TaxID=1710 RepID=UPI00130ECB12|nr:isoprenylcysteine carboxylmethyltransferase family protein [Cellulosimicrobium cellulans]
MPRRPPDPEAAVRDGARRYVGILLVQRALGAALFFLAAGRWEARGIAYFAVYTVTTAGAAALLHRRDPELLDARRRVQPGTEAWDRVLLLGYVLLAFYGVYAVAGAAVRLGHPPTAAGWFGAGMAITAVTCVLAVWPLLHNRGFESSVRIQRDRGQVVCTTGPYALVRHPGYAVILLWCAAVPMVFGPAAGLVAAAIVVVVVLRTALEDAMLRRELPGYADYARRVRRRLLPGVW